MKVFNCIASFSAWRSQQNAQEVGLVATMGHLHAGHAALLERSVVENAVTVLSVFVNPKQFNDPNDYKAYANTVEADLALARRLGVSAAFVPTVDAVYPDGDRYDISESQFSLTMEGECRPGHFTGVLTVVMKLLMIVRPLRAYFGEKDYQQYELVRGMAASFFMDVEVIACETVRAESGLALSSRNSRLSTAALAQATTLYATLALGLADERVREMLTEKGLQVEYVMTWLGRQYAAVTLDGVRLLDNVARRPAVVS